MEIIKINTKFKYSKPLPDMLEGFEDWQKGWAKLGDKLIADQINGGFTTTYIK